MNMVQIRAALLGRMKNSYSETPVAYPNKYFDPDSQAPDGEFVRVTVRSAYPTNYIERGSGGVGWRYGIINIHIFTRFGAGSERALEIADIIETLFRRISFGDNLYTAEPTTEELGDDGHGFYHAKVIIPWDCPTGC
jgi:hypothetical protein